MGIYICRTCQEKFEESRRGKWGYCEAHRLNRMQRYEQQQQHACVGCGAVVSRKAVRCQFCEQEHRIGLHEGADSVHYKGGRSIDKHGYVQILLPREERKGRRYRAEHTLVWERANGKIVPRGWVIHHINGTKTDNRLENLVAVSRSEHNHRHDDQERRIRELEAENTALREQLNAKGRQ